ncbi:hypothetical protein O7626_37605 [Micromonospora sp. WMMD1102]|uniref:hypothetical protein n=1 Tax=Micromonospora sp. WMMD1102 TaxID=3016105 RepID=UPI00241553C6|nr:hypothetical protein [Micromonospora sp. WMMD1102]MDG4791549.1 hypothetical protein [Micromonospora sp. WMMD1102]
MAGLTWRVSLTISPVAVLPTAALAVLGLALPGMDFDGGWGWGWVVPLLAAYLVNAGLDWIGTVTGYSGWISGRTGTWTKLRWLLTGVLVNLLLLAVLPWFVGLFGPDISTGGPGTLAVAAAVLGLCFYLGSRFEDVSLFFEKGAGGDGDRPSNAAE